jgi:hypothetical protein
MSSRLNCINHTVPHQWMARLDPSFGLANRISMATRGIAAAALVTGLLLLPAVIGGMIASHRHRKRSRIPGLSP